MIRTKHVQGVKEHHVFTRGNLQFAYDIVL